MSKKKVFKKSLLDWATNPLLQKNFPNYEDFLLWVEDFGDLTNRVDEYLSNPNAKTIKVTTTDVQSGKKTHRWFSKKEYEEWKKHGDSKKPNVRCIDCRHLSGSTCLNVNMEIHCSPDELVVCDFYDPLEPDETKST